MSIQSASLVDELVFLIVPQRGGDVKKKVWFCYSAITGMERAREALFDAEKRQKHKKLCIYFDNLSIAFQMKKWMTLLLAVMMLTMSIATMAEETVKTGTFYNEVWGETIANVVEKDGVVEKIVIDVVRDGATSKEQHDNYGVKPLSTIGKEWWEQVVYYEDWVRANGVDAVEYDENGHALNADLISGCTINITNFTEAVKAAQGK